MEPRTQQSQPLVHHHLTSSAVDHLFHHILDGYKSSHEGLINLKQKGLVSDEELAELLTKNGERLIKRIMEFKVVERLVCVFFAALFGLMQLTCNDLDMRRTRTGVRVKRRQETQQTI